MKNYMRIKLILLVILFFPQHFSFSQSDLFWQNSLPPGNNLNPITFNNVDALAVVGGNAILFQTTSGGADCGCTTIGSFVNPDKGVAPTVKGDLTSPKGKYKIVIGGSGPYTIWIKLVSNNTTIYQTNVPGGSWGFSPDDDRFLTTYSSSGIQMTKLVDLTTSPVSQVWSSQVLTGSSRLQFSPFGDYLMYNTITAPSHTRMIIVDTRSGRVVYQTEFTFQTIPDDPDETHGMATWGFSPDTSSRTFVYAWISGQSSVNFTMVNLETRLVVKNSTINAISAYWQFSPCGDVLGIVQETSSTQILAQLYKTVSIQTILAEQSHTLIAPIVLSNNDCSHIISVGGTPYILADNTADSPCSNEFVAVTVPDTLTGGFKGTGTVRLNNPATGSAVVVSLSSNHPEMATVPSSVTVPIGVKMSTFTIQSSVVQSDASVVITATATSVTRRDTMILRAFKIKSLQLPDTVAGGSTVYGEITLNDIAPSAGIPVTFESDTPSVATAPAGFTIPSGTMFRNFSFKTNPVMDFTRATITARISNSEKSKTLMIRPPNLDSLSISSSTIKGGNPATLTIWLDGNASSGGAAVLLSSTDTGIITMIDTAIVPANDFKVSIPFTTKGVASTVSVTFTASYHGIQKMAILDVQPPDISSVVNNPCAVCGMTGGATTDITINLNGEAPPGGAMISLTSNNEGLIKPPASVTVPAGLRSIIAPLTTSSVTANTTVRITAQYGSSIMAVDIVLGAAGKYSVIDLGIPPGYTSTSGDAINDSNVVLFSAYGGDPYSGTSPAKLSFIWKNGQSTKLSPPANHGLSFYVIGNDININSHVTGTFGTAFYNEQAFLWIGGLTSILPVTAITSGGSRINDSDWIIGNGNDGLDFIYKDGNVFSLLESIPGATSIGQEDINNKGQVVGTWYNNNDSVWGAFLWDNGTASEIKSSLSDYVISHINAVNDSGYVAGTISKFDPGLVEVKAFIWRNGNMEIVPTPPGYRDTYAWGMNNRREVVGYLMKANDGGGYSYYPMLYRDGVVYNLNDLIPDPARCMISSAYKINNLGSIVLTGWINGVQHAMLLIPPEDLNTDIRPGEINRTDHLLGQNFPNPFNYSTTIPYHLPEATHVKLAIIDLPGREVEILVDEVQQAGERSVEFKTDKLSVGVYFYHLQAGSYSETKRMLLLR